jgi:hypothetical protein
MPKTKPSVFRLAMRRCLDRKHGEQRERYLGVNKHVFHGATPVPGAILPI